MSGIDFAVLANALPLSIQDLDRHLKLHRKHCEQVFAIQVGQISTGGVGQFYSGANTSARKLPEST